LNAQQEVDLHDFETEVSASALDPNQRRAFSLVMGMLTQGTLPFPMVKEIATALKAYGSHGQPDETSVEDDVYDETFSMAEEVHEVMKAVKLLRKSIMAPGGKALKKDITTTEAKDVISMSNTMINTLMKSHEKIMNMERYRAVEQATVDVLRELDGDEKLITALEKFHEEGKKGDGPLVENFINALEIRLDP